MSQEIGELSIPQIRDLPLTPEGKKKLAAFNSTCQNVSTFTKDRLAALFTAITIAGVTPCFAAPTVEIETMKNYGYSSENIEKIRDLSKKVQDAHKEGKIPPSSYQSITEVSPIKKDGTGLDGLISGGVKSGNEKGASFKEIAGAEELNRANYASIVEELFKEGDPKQKDRWLKKLDDYTKQGKDPVIEEWFKRFNFLAKNTIHGSREEYRRGFIAALSIAEFPSLPDSTKKITSAIVMSQAGEYILITDPQAHLIKIGRDYGTGSLQYLIPSNIAFDKINFSEWKTAVTFAIEAWNQDLAKKIEITQKEIIAKEGSVQLTQDKTQLAQDKTQLAQDKTQLAQDKTQLAQDKTQLAQKEGFSVAFNRFAITADVLTKKITLLENPKNRENSQLLQEINTLLQEFRKSKTEIDEYFRKDTEKKLSNDKDRTNIEQLYKTILSTLAVYKIS